MDNNDANLWGLNMQKLLQAKKDGFTLLTAVIAFLLLLAMGAGLLGMCLKSRIFSARTASDITVNPTKGPSVSPPASKAAQKVFISSIVYSVDRASAVINDRIVHEGDTVGGVTVVKIFKDRVVFEKKGTGATLRRTQKIREVLTAHLE